MSIQSTPSSSPVLSYLDGLAAGLSDVWLLIGRILLCWTFVAVGWGHIGNMGGFVGYMTNLHVSAPGFWVWPATIAEILISISLVFGIATRYGAALGVIFLIVATALAHRYWEYPPAQVVGQYNNFLKNLSMLGGMLYMFVAGPGRISIDAMWRSK